MSIGISTASFYPMETEEAVKIISENNVECTEIFLNSKREYKDSFADYILDITGETGIKISAVHPMLSFAEPYMIFSEYSRRFEESQDIYRKYFEFAANVGAKFVNLHGDRPNGKLAVEEYCERFLILSNIGKTFGVTLCQENVNGYRSADPEFLRDMVRFLGNEVNFTLDVKQCIRAGYTVLEIMQAMDFKIRHTHISDHSVAGDCLLPGVGNFDFANLFKILENHGCNGDCVIEVYNNAYHHYGEILQSYKSLKNKNKIKNVKKIEKRLDKKEKI